MSAVALSSCNEESSSATYTSPINLAVTSFSLKADNENTGLDSVYFTIDLDNGIIFNADSLRKGTKVNKVVPLVSFSSEISEATFIMSGGTTREGEVNFKKNPTDSIDFTGNVTLRVKADNNKIETTYRVKVNVHKTDPDTLVWSDIEQKSVASRLENPQAMKTVLSGSSIISLIEENDGTYSKSIAQSIDGYNWNASEITFPFKPEVETLCSSDESLWILADDGSLWQGDIDLSNWTQTGEIWCSMIGTYNNTAIGLCKEGEAIKYAQYPLTELNIKQIPADFPIKGTSNFVTLSNLWTSSPVAFFTGGIDASGKYINDTWAFDGAEWIKLCEGGVPALEGASIIPYYNYRPSASGDSMIEYSVWMLIGGKEANGEFNRTVYISYDNGVNWSPGANSLQLPDAIPPMVYCDNIVADIQKDANLSDGWKTVAKSPKRIKYWTDGDIISWNCPYIFLVGGYSPEGKLYTNVWRGVLNRLTFTPII